MRRAFELETSEEHERERWDWIFIRNPSGAGLAYLLAVADDRIAGQYATMPVRLQHAGERVTGLLSLYTATDPEFERQGIFTTLARELYESARETAPIVFGFPNPNSAPAFYRKLEWVELRPFPLLLRPLGDLRKVVGNWRPKLAPVARAVDLVTPALGLPAAVERGARRTDAVIQRFDRFGPWADDLWNGLAPLLGTCAVRDAAFLNWRFCDAPFRYTRFAVLRDGVPSGVAVTTTQPWRGGRLAHLMELMVPASDPVGAARLLAAALDDAAAEGAVAMQAIASRNHPHRRAMKKAGFLPVPAGLAGNQSFGVRHNGPGVIPNSLFHVDDWYISGADLDFV